MMGGRREIVLVLFVLAMAAAPARAAEAPRVSVVVPPGHGDQPIDGRLLGPYPDYLSGGDIWGYGEAMETVRAAARSLSIAAWPAPPASDERAA